MITIIAFSYKFKRIWKSLKKIIVKQGILEEIKRIAFRISINLIVKLCYLAVGSSQLSPLKKGFDIHFKFSNADIASSREISIDSKLMTKSSL